MFQKCSFVTWCFLYLHYQPHYNTKYMKIREDILKRINNVRSRRAIAIKLNVGEQMIYAHINQNREDGALTKMKALVAISEELGIQVADLIEETDADLVKR